MLQNSVILRELVEQLRSMSRDIDKLFNHSIRKWLLHNCNAKNDWRSGLLVPKHSIHLRELVDQLLSMRRDIATGLQE